MVLHLSVIFCVHPQITKLWHIDERELLNRLQIITTDINISEEGETANRNIFDDGFVVVTGCD